MWEGVGVNAKTVGVKSTQVKPDLGGRRSTIIIDKRGKWAFSG